MRGQRIAQNHIDTVTLPDDTNYLRCWACSDNCHYYYC